MNITTLKLRVIIIAISIIVVYSLLFSISDFEKFSQVWTIIKLEYIPVIIGLLFSSQLIRSLRQKFFFKSLDIKLSFRENFLLFFSSLSLISTPGGTGELIKSYFLKLKHGYSYSKTTGVVLAEKFQNVLAVVSILFLMSAFEYVFEIFIVTVIMGILVISIFIIIKNVNVFHVITLKLSKVRFFKSIFQNIPEFYDSINILFNKKTFFIGWGLGLFAVFVDASAFFLIFQAFDLNLNFVNASSIVIVSNILGAISFLPAGIIVTETSLMGLLLKNEIDVSTASALIVFIRLITVWGFTFLGMIMLKFIIKIKT